MLRDKSFLWFGLSVGVLLVILQVFHYKALLHEIDLEILEGIIAVIFLAFGILITLSFKRVKKWIADQKTANKAGLSERELEVLELLAVGYSNQEIADKLFVSLNTIKTHISNIYGKLNVTRRTQAIQKARNLRILSSEGVKGQNHPKV